MGICSFECSPSLLFLAVTSSATSSDVQDADDHSISSVLFLYIKIYAHSNVQLSISIKRCLILRGHFKSATSNKGTAFHKRFRSE